MLFDPKCWARSMPVLLPHRLVPWLIRSNLWPEVPPQDRFQYWSHHKRMDSGITAPSPEHHPLWIWGDDVRYGKRIEQKVMVAMLGHVLDTRKDTYACCFPLWVCGYETWQVHDSAARVLVIVTDLKCTDGQGYNTTVMTDAPQELSLGMATIAAYMEPVSCKQCA